MLDKQGADAVRWYFYAGGSPWLPTRFSGELVSEMQRKFMGTLWNTYAFFTMYAVHRRLQARRADSAEEEDFTLMDKWALSKLNTLVKFVDEGLSEYKITETARAIAGLRGRAVQLVRAPAASERFWGKDMDGRQDGRLRDAVHRAGHA